MVTQCASSKGYYGLVVGNALPELVGHCKALPCPTRLCFATARYAGALREGLRAAAAIGDDTLQRNAGRRVTPESFTHGTSEQRQRWFTAGYRSGDVGGCDTFSAGSL